MNESQVKEDCSLESLVGRVADEFLRRQEQGEQPEVEEYTARHPEAAEVLRKVLTSLRILERSADGAPAAADGSAEQPPALLGDFRLLREIGRGGMGVVYEAEQLSLRRRVALKVLPFAAVMDPRQLQRFQIEAQAAACLHHTSIVPVHAVGSERGVHFYAMQFIDGRPLDAVIQDLRRQQQQRLQKGAAQPDEAPTHPPTTPYAGAALVPAATPSMETARPIQAGLSTEQSITSREFFQNVARLGILHRDIKPANLLLDVSGNLWITDFGLARVQNDIHLSMTGDLIGTLRYMSPEQALAKRVVVDHRTDIYSLGVTLYELLTLRPAFSGEDRQELLRQIAFEEPRPPRRFNRALPAELETIVVKALEKNSAERYATAQELADDLRRWMEDRPIQARRPSWRQVALKWSRRHRAVVWATAAVALLAAGLGGVNGVWWLQKRSAAEAEAQAVLQEVGRLRAAERWAEALRAVRRAKGALFGVGTSPQLRAEVEKLEKDVEMVLRLQEASVAGQEVAREHPETIDWAASNTAYAREFEWYGLDVDRLDPREAGEWIRSRTIAAQLAAALEDWAFMRRELALPGSGQLVAIARVAEPDPRRDLLRDALERKDPKPLDEFIASAGRDPLPPATKGLLFRLAVMQRDQSERALMILQRLQQRHPGHFSANLALGLCLATPPSPRLEEAIRFFTAAVAIQPLSARAHMYLALALQKKKQWDQALAEYQEALHLDPGYALAHNNLGTLLGDMGRREDAIQSLKEALRLKPDLAPAHYNLGNQLSKMGLREEAIAEYRAAIHFKKDYAKAHYNLGCLLNEKGLLKGAIAEYRAAIEFQKDHASAYCNLGNALLKLGDRAGAIAAARQAIRLDPKKSTYHNNLGHYYRQDEGMLDEAMRECREAIHLEPGNARAHTILGAILVKKGRLDEAVAELHEAIRHEPNAAQPYLDLSNALGRQNKLDEAAAACRKVVELRPQDASAHSNLGIVLQAKGEFALALGHFRRSYQLASGNPRRWPQQTYAQQVKNCERLVELDAKLPGLLKGEVKPTDTAERLALAEICQQHRSLYAAAARFYGAALAEQPKLADDLQQVHRYNAACAAALAGCGRGKDAEQSDDKERARLRSQARAWLRADLAAWRRLLAKQPGQTRPVVRQTLQHWQQDKDFAGVRGPAALTQLPAVERQEWQHLWTDVDALLATVQERAAVDQKPAQKGPAQAK